MTMRLRAALRETLDGWQDDIASPWRDVITDVALGFEQVDATLELEPWEPIFPARRGRTPSGRAAGRAHAARLRRDRSRERALRDRGPGPLSVPRLRHRAGLRGGQRRPLAGARQDVLAERPRGDPARRRGAHRRGSLRRELRAVAGDAGGHRGRRGRSGGARGAGRALGRLRRAAAQQLAHALPLPPRGRSAPGEGAPSALASLCWSGYSTDWRGGERPSPSSASATRRPRRWLRRGLERLDRAQPGASSSARTPPRPTRCWRRRTRSRSATAACEPWVRSRWTGRRCLGHARHHERQHPGRARLSGAAGSALPPNRRGHPARSHSPRRVVHARPAPPAQPVKLSNTLGSHRRRRV